MKIAILGGDGFVGWPTALHLSDAGHDIHILDNLSRRWIDTELGVQSLTPMDSIQERTRIWHAETGRRIHFNLIDLAGDYELLKKWLDEHRPDAIVHFAEQRAAPYSMKSDRHKNYTVNNNVNATHNLLNALVELDLDPHLVHLGTMGVYGYSTIGAAIPEGYLPVGIETAGGETVNQEILYPSNPGSIYHMTKCLDQLLFQFYAKNDGLRITDLHQGIVWGTHTAQTRRHPQLINRFDYDGDYGTVLNRFLIQAAIGYPLTVHGTGGQTRAFIRTCAEEPAGSRQPRRDLQSDDRDASRPRPRRNDRQNHRLPDRLAAEPAQGSARERSRRAQREVPGTRPRSHSPRRRAAFGNRRRGEEIRLPRRPLARAGRFRLDEGHRAPDQP
jgi:UDP-sulfoquinovose synthase